MIVALISGTYDEQGVEGLVEIPDEQALAFEAEAATLESEGSRLFKEICDLARQPIATSKDEEEYIAELRAESKENYQQQQALTQRIRAAAKPLEKSMLLYLPGT